MYVILQRGASPPTNSLFPKFHLSAPKTTSTHFGGGLRPPTNFVRNFQCGVTDICWGGASRHP